MEERERGRQSERARTLGRDPCRGAMSRTEEALLPGVPGGQAVVVVDM